MRALFEVYFDSELALRAMFLDDTIFLSSRRHLMFMAIFHMSTPPLPQIAISASIPKAHSAYSSIPLLQLVQPLELIINSLPTNLLCPNPVLRRIFVWSASSSLLVDRVLSIFFFIPASVSSSSMFFRSSKTD